MIEGLLRPQHLLIILVVALFVFGGKKLPELGKGLGEGIKGFKDSLRNATSDSDKTVSTAEPADKKV
ncbi:MAG TPA: twin-arginine translocase TatA/TatE family subunit [Bryobacteraceae bacterium]|nr:twin-arginine translocase TatA/TatE family subunit [Bryobacteraceae bacterium]